MSNLMMDADIVRIKNQKVSFAMCGWAQLHLS